MSGQQHEGVSHMVTDTNHTSKTTRIYIQSRITAGEARIYMPGETHLGERQMPCYDDQGQSIFGPRGINGGTGHVAIILAPAGLSVNPRQQATPSKLPSNQSSYSCAIRESPVRLLGDPQAPRLSSQKECLFRAPCLTYMAVTFSFFPSTYHTIAYGLYCDNNILVYGLDLSLIHI